MGEELILYVEGNYERTATIYQRMSARHRERTIWARTADEAIDVLRNYKGRLALVVFSNDLNEFVKGDVRREDSGGEIVRYLEKQFPVEYKGCRFVLQGWDKKVERRLVNRLNDKGYVAGYRPFGM